MTDSDGEMEMNAIAKAVKPDGEFEQLKARLKATWATGDYSRFSRYMEKDATEFYHRLGISWE